jgi:hypothetical protein
MSPRHVSTEVDRSHRWRIHRDHSDAKHAHTNSRFPTRDLGWCCRSGDHPLMRRAFRYSILSAVIGSTRVARRAGIQHATNVTPSNNAATIA